MSTNISIVNNYVRNLPTQIPKKMTQGFILTAAASLVLAGTSAPVALLGGAIAATATLIEALTRPIIFGLYRREAPFIAMCIQIILPAMAAFSLANAVAPMIGVAYRMNGFLIPVLAWITLNDRWDTNNVAMVRVF